MKKSNIMPSIVLGAICLIVGLLLSLINSVTAPIIEEAQNAAANAALAIVLPEGKNFDEISIDESYPAVITKGYKADGGFVFQSSVTGKSSGLIILCGINSDGKIVGTKVIAEQETDSYDANVFPLVEGTEGKYKGMDIDNFEPWLVSGATLTSRAYGEAVKASLQAFAIANGGSVDVRTPEQILQDNCNEALGTTDVKFTKWFATESLSGIDAVYTADDNSGRVFAVGESFIGVKADGTIVNAGSADAAAITAANTAVSASALTEITSLPEGVNTKFVKKAYVTASGNYVFDLEATGYQAMFDYGNGTVIKIKLSISADGKIIDCLTVSHDESKGFGDACATEEYYDQFRGASDADIKLSVTSPNAQQDQIPDESVDKGAISSATYTTYGYQKAVKEAFAAYNSLKSNGGDK
ncbi:MAG: FMN-binding protein [Ruminococcaceae bacterium]|nr:FMN-binding protein [Oscillospiraceae bacterium]